MNFKELGINEDIVKILKNTGITKPTAIQQESIVFIKEGRPAQIGGFRGEEGR